MVSALPSAALFAAPHRALFLIGSAQFVLAMLWWSGVLAAYLGQGEGFPATLLHGPMMLFLVLPPLFFGFLLTVLPRWTGYSDNAWSAFVPTAIGFALAAALFWAGVAGMGTVLPAAFAASALAQAYGAAWLLRDCLRERRDGKGPTWHAYSILCAITFGIIGSVAAALFIGTMDAGWQIWANHIGLYLLILPVFWTVCHRMVPFFAANVVEGYVRWRPFWLLIGLWLGSIALTIGQVAGWTQVAGVGASLLLVLTMLMTYRWWPRAKAPALLWVLIIGFAWAPIGFALTLLEAIGLTIGRSAQHALTIGFAGSLIIAMVTRVTQGHSGRPLIMPRLAHVAFWGVQAAAILRIWAGMQGELPTLLLLSALILTAATAGWAARHVWIYFLPRKDGRPG